ncbi:ATP-binding cassette domain-containing protein [Secundilactobacillus paracollinoides]|uniref:ATP-binding cassette domain-containing protein n=1 Tax=Secundilactobacillus paracollinoides TaxID=240427 RepID=UPI00177B9700|nr:ABC transporter ATP-binding protein [Secundilactobacillus paracollinoides]
MTVKSISKKFNDRKIFGPITHQFKSNSFTAIKGASGTGKSTFLNIIGLTEEASTGKVLFNDVDVSNVSKSKIRNYYKTILSFVFQNSLLIPNLTIEENLSISSKFLKIKKGEEKELFKIALSQVGLDNFNLKQRAYTLSGGEQQRIAIARAFIKPSKIIIADEPTGSLDDENGFVVMNLLSKLQQSGKTIILVTHANQFDEFFDEVMYI